MMIRKLKLVLLIGALLPALSCNIFEFMDGPDGDPQLLDAARACFDAGDFECARNYYNRLSNSQSDTRLSELSLLSLAENGIISMKELIRSLGENSGGATSFTFMADLLAANGKTTAADRQIIQIAHANAEGIANRGLKGFTQLITSIAMLNSVLASETGADLKLQAADLVQTPGGCVYSSCTGDADCSAPSSGSVLTNTGTTYNLDTSANWTTSPPDLNMVIAAASEADEAIALITGGTGTGSGITTALQNLSDLIGVAASAQCKRAAIKQTLFPNN